MLTPGTMQALIEEHGRYIYHLAPSKSQGSVIEHGLLPSDELATIGLGGNPMYAGEWEARPGHVYFYTQALLSEYLADNAGIDLWGDDQEVLYRVDLLSLDPARITADEDAFWANMHSMREEYEMLQAPKYGLIEPTGNVTSMWDCEEDAAACLYRSYGQWAHEVGLGNDDPTLVIDAIDATGTLAVSGVIEAQHLVMVNGVTLEPLEDKVLAIA